MQFIQDNCEENTVIRDVILLLFHYCFPVSRKIIHLSLFRVDTVGFIHSVTMEQFVIGEATVL